MSQTPSLPSLAERARTALFPNYGDRSVAIVRGQGARCWDSNGKEYLDFLAGIGVNNLGHCHPAVVEAVRAQAERLIHCSNIYLIEPQVELAERLVRQSGLRKAFLCNSGTEATEAGIKLARRTVHDRRGPGHDTVLVFRGSFHGRTYGSMSATWSPKVRKSFGPLVPGFVFAQLNDLASVDAVWTDQVCGVLVETVQGEGGINPCTREFLRGLRARCTERGALLIADEIQCGMGRCGKAFAYQHDTLLPDVLLLAKALGGGLPLGAVVAGEAACDTFQPGSHGTTFGGNPVACAAANAVCQTIFQPEFLDRVGQVGCHWWGRLEQLHQEFPGHIEGVRGLGLMQGLVLKVPGGDLVGLAAEEGLLINCTADRVIRFLPPLIVGAGELEEAHEKLRRAMERFVEKHPAA